MKAKYKNKNFKIVPETYVKVDGLADLMAPINAPTIAPYLNSVAATDEDGNVKWRTSSDIFGTVWCKNYFFGGEEKCSLLIAIPDGKNTTDIFDLDVIAGTVSTDTGETHESLPIYEGNVEFIGDLKLLLILSTNRLAYNWKQGTKYLEPLDYSEGKIIIKFYIKCEQPSDNVNLRVNTYLFDYGPEKGNLLPKFQLGRYDDISGDIIYLNDVNIKKLSNEWQEVTYNCHLKLYDLLEMAKRDGYLGFEIVLESEDETILNNLGKVSIAGFKMFVGENKTIVYGWHGQSLLTENFVRKLPFFNIQNFFTNFLHY